MKIVLVAITCFILGGAAFYSFNQYQNVLEENKMLKLKTPALSPTTSVAVDVSKAPQVSPEAKMEKKAEEGSIEGTLGYPAGGIPKLEVYAFNSSNMKNYFMIETAVNQTSFEITGVLPGTYYVVAYPTDYSISGAYTKMVPCGLSVDCKDHSMIPVTVKAGEVTKGVEVKDWYAPDDAFPKKP